MMNTHSVEYKILHINNKTTEQKCIKTDNDNLKLYQKTIKNINKNSKRLKKSNINIEINVEEPPKPSNYDRLIIYRKNNINKPCYKQSIATIFLYNKGYILDKDYQACDAIEFMKRIKKERKYSKKRVNMKLYQNSDVNSDMISNMNTEKITIIKKTNSRNNIRNTFLSPEENNYNSLYSNLNELKEINDFKEFKEFKEFNNLKKIGSNMTVLNDNYLDNDEPEYGFSRNIIPSAPPYEENDYFMNDMDSKC